MWEKRKTPTCHTSCARCSPYIFPDSIPHHQADVWTKMERPIAQCGFDRTWAHFVRLTNGGVRHWWCSPSACPRCGSYLLPIGYSTKVQKQGKRTKNQKCDNQQGKLEHPPFGSIPNTCSAHPYIHRSRAMALRVIEVVRQLYNQLAATMITITCLIDNNDINRE